VEDAHAVVVSGVFSFGKDSVHGPAGEERTDPMFSPALFYVGDGPERFENAFAEIGAVWVVPEGK
jgi:hypothetical protein